MGNVVVFVGCVINAKSQKLIFMLLWVNADLSAFMSVMLIPSDREFDFGCFGLMFVCVVQLLHRKYVMIRDVYSFALSEWKRDKLNC